MKKLKKAKERYDNIAIPNELHLRIEQIIHEHKKEEESNIKPRITFFRIYGACAACIAAIFIIAVNSNEALARELEQLPVVGQIVKVVTVRSYQSEDTDQSVSYEEPRIESSEEGTKEFTDNMNQEIEKACARYKEEALNSVQEYKKAFLQTGGTEEEWAAHEVNVDIWYEIKGQTDKYLSLLIGANESWMNAGVKTQYYNLDMQNGKEVSLKDLLGKDYIDVVNTQICQQMKERSAHGDIYWTPEQGGFVSIDDTTDFYINSQGNPVIVFDKYEVAPGTMGRVEFEINEKE